MSPGIDCVGVAWGKEDFSQRVIRFLQVVALKFKYVCIWGGGTSAWGGIICKQDERQNGL